MKKFILILSVALVTTLTVWAASSWIKVDDSCGRCVMNDQDRICGVCAAQGYKGFMSGVDGTGKHVGDYLQYDYKCNRCGHTITYRNR